MRWIAPATICSVMILLCAQRDFCQQLTRDDLKRDPKSMPGERRCDRTIEISPGIKLKATIEVTARGNGVLRVANLKLKVVDGYDDGSYYEGKMLHTEFVDLNGDGFKDLVVTGVVVTTGDKETDPQSYEVVTAIYSFDPKTREFKEVFHCGPSLAI